MPTKKWGRRLDMDQARSHPDICAFTSELFYENRLHPHPGLEQQKIKSAGRIQGTGLKFLPVHDGNQNSSLEEADIIRDLVADILGSNSSWVATVISYDMRLDRIGLVRRTTRVGIKARPKVLSNDILFFWLKNPQDCSCIQQMFRRKPKTPPGTCISVNSELE